MKLVIKNIDILTISFPTLAALNNQIRIPTYEHTHTDIHPHTPTFTHIHIQYTYIRDTLESVEGLVTWSKRTISLDANFKAPNKTIIH